MKITITPLAATALMLAAGGASAQTGVSTEPTTRTPMTSNIPAGASASWDPVYNVCRGPDPRCYHPWVTNRQNRVLVYSRTAGPRHESIGNPLAAGLNPPLGDNNVMQKALVAWLNAEGITVDWTEDVNTFATTGLNKYKAIVFANTSRETFFKHGTAVNPTSAVNTSTGAHLEAAKTALMQYMRAGGGAVQIHNAVGGTDYQWPYFTGLAGSQYYDHGANQEGDLVSVGTDSSLDGIPTRWRFKDEFYNFYPYPERVKVILRVDESPLATQSTVHPGHGKSHPMAWCQYYDGGRSFTIAPGHDRLSWIDGSDFPGQAIYKRFVVQAIKSTMGLTPFCVQ